MKAILDYRTFHAQRARHRTAYVVVVAQALVTGAVPISHLFSMGFLLSSRLWVRSPMHASQQAAGLEKRLHHAEIKLAALTPPRGRGKRHITDEATLVEAIDRVLTASRVDGLLRVAWEKQGEQTTQYVGRGRGVLRREKRVIERTRSHIIHIAREEDTIADLRQRCGWKACVTKAGQTRRSLQDAVLGYRNAYRVARLCNRLKSRVHLAPLCVQLKAHMEGLTSLLTLGVRV